METNNDCITITISLIALFFSGLTALWTVWWREKIRLDVDFVKSVSGYFCFEVTNRGFLPVTISKMSMSLNGSKRKPILAFKAHPTPSPKESLPLLLEPRTSAPIYFGDVASEDLYALIGSRFYFVFMETACGHFHKQMFELPCDVKKSTPQWDSIRTKRGVFVRIKHSVINWRRDK